MSFRHNDVVYLSRCPRCQQTDCRRDYYVDRLHAPYSAEEANDLVVAARDAIVKCRQLEKSLPMPTIVMPKLR